MAVRGPVCILAGAGTGKTRAITHRIAYGVHTGVFRPEHVLAVTFTARAASEMRTRLARLGVGAVQARTFHAAALRQLKYFSPRILGGSMPDLLDRPLQAVGNAAARSRLKTDRATLRDLAGEIEWAKAVLAAPADYPKRAAEAARQTPFPPDVVAKVYEHYEQGKQRAGVLDFADLLLVLAGALEQLDDVAAQVRGQYRAFVVDEYQDVSPLQHRLLSAWLGDRRDLCVVGDANQTIYSFAGATPGYLLGFGRAYPEATVVRLDRDYRSTPQVVELANRLVKSGAGRPGSGPAGAAASAGVALIGQLPDGPVPSFAEYDDEPAEAAAAAALCRSLIDTGTPPAEIAVLFRVNAQSEVYEQALTTLGIPYVLRGGERFFDRAEIREARLLLRGAARSDAADEPMLDTVRAVLSGLGWHPDDPPAGGAAREKWESLAALVGLAEEIKAMRPDASLDDLAVELDQRATAQHAPTVQGVTLASLHAAKGLEWTAVLLVGLTDGTIPTQHARTDEQIAEERRLLYVGITRARSRLALSWALARTPGQARRRRPSRFLDDLRPSRPASASAPRPAKARKAADDVGDVATFGRLRTWRRKQSEAQGVPAFVVFSDATLAAIADAAPADRAELAQVSGVGPVKLDRYCAPVLAAVAGGEPEPVEITE